MSLRVYLSGCFSGRFAAEVKAERLEATNLLHKRGLHVLDPAKAEEAVWGNSKTAKISKKMKRSFMETMVKNDKWLIRRSDVLLVLTGNIISDGTYKEVDYAQRIEIPVVMISSKRYSEELMGWTNVLVGRQNIFPTLEKAVSYISRRYVKEHEAHKRAFNLCIKKGKHKNKR